MKFIIMVWLAFFARHKTGFDDRESGLHEHDQEAGDSVQMKLIAILFWPTWLAMSPTVRPFAVGFLSVTGSATAMSVMVPVRLRQDRRWHGLSHPGRIVL